MDISEIINYLEKNDLTEIEELQQSSDNIVVQFYYDFDKDELNAAKSYSNEESDYESESDEWYNEYYIPYLNDIAIDNVESIIEEIIDEFEVEGKFKHIGMEKGNGDYSKFIAVFSESLNESELEDILNDCNY